MADSRFYPDLKPISVEDIAVLVRGEVLRGHKHDDAAAIGHPASARPGELCFVSNDKAAASLPDMSGIICLVRPDLEQHLPQSVTAIAVPDPKMALGLVIRAMLPAETAATGIDPSASIAASAVIGDNCRIAPNVVIEDGVSLGDGCRIGPGVFIGKGCRLGNGVSIEANTTLRFTDIGDNTDIGANVVIGHDGFAVGRDQGNMIIPHLGLVRIGSHVHIGPGSAIDRGFIEDTVIGDRVMIDNNCHFGHNVVMGEGNVFCAQTGVAGSVVIGRNNVFGAQCGVGDNVSIGDGNMFAARTGVTKDIGHGNVMGGFPAVPVQDFRRQVAAIRRLSKKKGASHD